MQTFTLKDRRFVVPTAVQAKGRDAVVHAVLDQACPRDGQGNPVEDDWALPFDPRDVKVDDFPDRAKEIDDPEVLGFLRAMELRATAKKAITARIDEVLGDDDEEA